MIIAFSGHANSGKDTAAQFVRTIDNRYEVMSFARKLKQMAAILTGWEDQFSREGKAHFLPQWGMTAGEIQQKLGTDAVRYGIRDDAWIIALMQDYAPDKYWVITDMRFPNELQAVRKAGGFVIRIERDVQDDCGRNSKHPSETSLDNWKDWDFVIDNNRDMNNLFLEVKAIMEEIG